MPDAMTVRLRDPKSDYEGAYLDPVTVEGVRFERREALNPANHKLADGAQGRIWIDAVNSEGAFEIPVGSAVDVGGRRMRVVACQAFAPYGKVHHWEVDVG